VKTERSKVQIPLFMTRFKDKRSMKMEISKVQITRLVIEVMWNLLRLKDPRFKWNLWKQKDPRFKSPSLQPDLRRGDLWKLMVRIPLFMTRFKERKIVRRPQRFTSIYVSGSFNSGYVSRFLRDTTKQKKPTEFLKKNYTSW